MPEQAETSAESDKSDAPKCRPIPRLAVSSARCNPPVTGLVTADRQGFPLLGSPAGLRRGATASGRSSMSGWIGSDKVRESFARRTVHYRGPERCRHEAA